MKKLPYYLSLLALFILTIGGLTVAGQQTTIKAEEAQPQTTISPIEAEKEKKTSKIQALAVSSDIVWTNWQKDAKLSAPSERTSLEATAEYNLRYTRKYTFDLAEIGDTIPNLIVWGSGLEVNNTPCDPGSLVEVPQFTIPKMGVFKLSNPDLWENYPVDIPGEISVEGEQITAKNGSVGLYSSGNTYTHRYYMTYIYKNNRNNRPTFTMDGRNGNHVTFEFEQYLNLDPYVVLIPENGFGFNSYLPYEFHIPQVVKAVYKDIEEQGDPDKVIASGEIAGKNGVMDQKVSHQSKDIEGYEFDHYEYVDEDGNSSESKEEKWTGSMTRKKQAVIFWYKKKTPDLAITKTADKKEANIGDKLMYTVTLENKGNAALADALLTDTLPQGMSKPEAVKLDGTIIKEGSENATAEGCYYTWTDASRQLVVHAGSIPEADKKILTYETSILSGKDGEKKLNTAVLTGSNTEQQPEAKEEITVKRKLYLHVKQEILQKNEQLVVPDSGAVLLDNVKLSDKNDSRETYTLVIPSYEADTSQAFKKVGLAFDNDYLGYIIHSVIPEFYLYKGYQITTNQAPHVSSAMKTGALPMLDYTTQSDYWVTIYLQPSVEKEGPPYYSWDEVMNDFGTLKVESKK